MKKIVSVLLLAALLLCALSVTAETAAAVPEEMIGTWHGTGTPKNGGSSIDLTAVISADGTGEYTFEQAGYVESFPFTLSYTDNTFSVDLPATSMMTGVEGTWEIRDGKLLLDITSTFINGRTYSYNAECEKEQAAAPAAEVPAVEGVAVDPALWQDKTLQLASIYFKSSEGNNVFEIDATLGVSGPLDEYGYELVLNSDGTAASDLNFDGLFPALGLPFSIPGLDLTACEGWRIDAENPSTLVLLPAETPMAMNYDEAAGQFSLTWGGMVDIQSQTNESGLVSAAGQVYLEITPSFAPAPEAE